MVLTGIILASSTLASLTFVFEAIRFAAWVGSVVRQPSAYGLVSNQRFFVQELAAAVDTLEVLVSEQRVVLVLCRQVFDDVIVFAACSSCCRCVVSGRFDWRGLVVELLLLIIVQVKLVVAVVVEAGVECSALTVKIVWFLTYKINDQFYIFYS